MLCDAWQRCHTPCIAPLLLIVLVLCARREFLNGSHLRNLKPMMSQSRATSADRCTRLAVEQAGLLILRPAARSYLSLQDRSYRRTVAMPTLSQAGVTDCVGSEPVDPTGFEKGWTHGTVVLDAAKRLVKLYKCLKKHLRELADAVEEDVTFPRWRLHEDSPEYVEEPHQVRPWMLSEEPLPSGLVGREPNSDDTAMMLCTDLNGILKNPDRASRCVNLMEDNSRQWQEWFQKQALLVSKSEGTNLPDELLFSKVTGEPRKLLEYLWQCYLQNKDATHEELLREVWPDKVGYDSSNIYRNVTRLRDQLSGTSWFVESVDKKTIGLTNLNRN